MNKNKFIELLQKVDNSFSASEDLHNHIVMLASSDLNSIYVSNCIVDRIIEAGKPAGNRIFITGKEFEFDIEGKVIRVNDLINMLNNVTVDNMEVVMKVGNFTYDIMDIGLSKFGNNGKEFINNRLVIHDLRHEYIIPNSCDNCIRSKVKQCELLDEKCLLYHNSRAIENFLRCNQQESSIEIYNKELENQMDEMYSKSNHKLNFIQSNKIENIIINKLKPLKKEGMLSFEHMSLKTVNNNLERRRERERMKKAEIINNKNKFINNN